MLKRILKFSVICILAFIEGCSNLNDDEKVVTEHVLPAQTETFEYLQSESRTDSLVVYRDLSQNGKKFKVSLICDENEPVSLQVEDKKMELFMLNQIYGKSQFNPSLFVFEKYIVIPEVMQYEDDPVYGKAIWVYVFGNEKPVRIIADTQKVESEQLLQWYIALSKVDEGIDFNDYAFVSHNFAYNKKDMAYIELYTYLDNTGNLCLLAPNSVDSSDDSKSIVFVKKVKDGAIGDQEHFNGEIRTVVDSSNGNSYALLTYSFAGASSSPVSSWLYNLNSGEISVFIDNSNYFPDMRCTLEEEGGNLIAVFPYLNLEETIPLSDIDDEVLIFLRENEYLDGKTIIDDFIIRSPEQIALVDNNTIAVWQRTSRKWLNRPIVTYFKVVDGKKSLQNYEFRRDFLSMGEYIQN